MYTRRERRVQALREPLRDHQLVWDGMELRGALKRLEQACQKRNKVRPLSNALELAQRLLN